MEQVSVLRPAEHVCLNPDRFVQLKRQLGEVAAKDVLGRAMEELALRLEHVHDCHMAAEPEKMRKYTRSLLAIADQIGLDTLTMVADDVLHCIDSGDYVALCATERRLRRIGKHSLSEIWEMQGAGS